MTDDSYTAFRAAAQSASQGSFMEALLRDELARERNRHQVTVLKLETAESELVSVHKWLDDAHREAALAAARARIAELERRLSEFARSATVQIVQIHELEQRLREVGK